MQVRDLTDELHAAGARRDDPVTVDGVEVLAVRRNGGGVDLDTGRGDEPDPYDECELDHVADVGPTTLVRTAADRLAARDLDQPKADAADRPHETARLVECSTYELAVELAARLAAEDAERRRARAEAAAAKLARPPAQDTKPLREPGADVPRSICGVRLVPPGADWRDGVTLVCARCRRAVRSLRRLGDTAADRARARRRRIETRAARHLHAGAVHPAQVALAPTGELTTALDLEVAARTGAP